MEAIFMFGMFAIIFSVLLWRIESIKDDIIDEIAHIERLVDMDESDGDVIHPEFRRVFGDGSEK